VREDLVALRPWGLGGLECAELRGEHKRLCVPDGGARLTARPGKEWPRKIQGVLWVAPRCVVDNAARFLSLGLGAKKSQGTR
jgi:hypothetical protein